MDFKLDSKDFDDKMRKLIGSVMPEKIEKGIGVAMLDLLNDCIMEVPTVPLREGWLRGSGSIFVQNKFIRTSEGIGEGKPKFANKNYSSFMPKYVYEGVIGFNAPYAARTHEIPMKFVEPSSGNKYLESKLLTKRAVYVGDIADTIKG